MAIVRVWIEEGCIGLEDPSSGRPYYGGDFQEAYTDCRLCEETCPQVFRLGHQTAEVIEGADLVANEDCIRQAAEECPAEVIAFEEE